MPRVFRDPCLACGKSERTSTPQGAACAFCGVSRSCPPFSEWPKPVKRWLMSELLRGLMRPHGGESEHAWRMLLAGVLRNRSVPLPSGVRYTTAIAASADDVWPLAVKLASETKVNDL